MANDGGSKNARREHAREVARQRRAEEQKRQRRNRWFLQGGLGAGVIAIIVVVIIVIANSTGSTTSTTAGPANMGTDGIVFQGSAGKVVPVEGAGVKAKGTPAPVESKNTDGSSTVVTYIDWACPVCKQFESAYSKQILALVAQGKATLAIHPVSILDRSYGTTRYASRAANAAACVANYDPTKFLDVQTAFYDNQPAEGSNGLTNKQIKALITGAGVTDSKVASCVDSETYKAWVTAATNRVLGNKALINPSQNSFGTPTVIVNGKMWDGTSDLLSQISKS
jgi:protein-disulfide isomerase